MSLGALAGLLAVFAIAARNGIATVTHYRRLERHAGETHGLELVMRGARERLVPILMTASAAALAVLPLIVLGTRPGYELVHPMAIVLVGGLVTSTLLALFVVPALYLRFGGGAPSAMAPELELLHRWAGLQPTAEDVTESTKEVAVEEHGRAPAASGAQVEEGSSETDKAQH